MSNENELVVQTTEVIESVENLDIVDIDSLNIANGIILSIDKLKKKIIDYWSNPIKSAFDNHKSLVALRNEMLNPIEIRRKILKTKISVFLTEENRKTKELQAKINKENKEKEENMKEYVPPLVLSTTIGKTLKSGNGTMTQRKDIIVTITDEIEILKQVVSGVLPISVVEVNIMQLKKHIRLLRITSMSGCNIEETIETTHKSFNEYNEY